MKTSISLAVLLVLAVGSASAEDSYCTDSTGECEAAVEIYDATRDNPVADVVEDIPDSDTGQSLDDHMEEATTTQDSYTGEPLPED
jgi:hypothetical protein